ncbi:hypothetical protein [Veronia nyctiphanis]|uniref:hypothetical protein n=1 Tax=Veronia nyctiphanis TaxID=1278244 RepID=UPI00100B0D38|nr:hypothetical protein [Veronia nyctiphanis]
MVTFGVTGVDGLSEGIVNLGWNNQLTIRSDNENYYISEMNNLTFSDLVEVSHPISNLVSAGNYIFASKDESKPCSLLKYNLITKIVNDVKLYNCEKITHLSSSNDEKSIIVSMIYNNYSIVKRYIVETERQEEIFKLDIAYPSLKSAYDSIKDELIYIIPGLNYSYIARVKKGKDKETSERVFKGRAKQVKYIDNSFYILVDGEVLSVNLGDLSFIYFNKMKIDYSDDFYLNDNEAFYLTQHTSQKQMKVFSIPPGESNLGFSMLANFSSVVGDSFSNLYASGNIFDFNNRFNSSHEDRILHIKSDKEILRKDDSIFISKIDENNKLMIFQYKDSIGFFDLAKNNIIDEVSIGSKLITTYDNKLSDLKVISFLGNKIKLSKFDMPNSKSPNEFKSLDLRDINFKRHPLENNNMLRLAKPAAKLNWKYGMVIGIYEKDNRLFLNMIDGNKFNFIELTNNEVKLIHESSTEIKYFDTDNDAFIYHLSEDGKEILKVKV